MRNIKFFSELHSNMFFWFLIMGTVGISVLTTPIWLFNRIEMKGISYKVLFFIILVLVLCIIAYIIWATIIFILMKIFHRTETSK